MEHWEQHWQQLKQIYFAQEPQIELKTGGLLNVRRFNQLEWLLADRLLSFSAFLALSFLV